MFLSVGFCCNVLDNINWSDVSRQVRQPYDRSFTNKCSLWCSGYCKPFFVQQSISGCSVVVELHFVNINKAAIYIRNKMKIKPEIDGHEQMRLTCAILLCSPPLRWIVWVLGSWCLHFFSHLTVNFWRNLFSIHLPVVASYICAITISTESYVLFYMSYLQFSCIKSWQIIFRCNHRFVLSYIIILLL